MKSRWQFLHFESDQQPYTNLQTPYANEGEMCHNFYLNGTLMPTAQPSRDVNSIAASHSNRLQRRFSSFLITVQQFAKWKDREKTTKKKPSGNVMNYIAECVNSWAPLFPFSSTPFHQQDVATPPHRFDANFFKYRSILEKSNQLNCPETLR